MDKLQREDHQILKILRKIEKGYINTIYKVVNSILYRLRNDGQNVLDFPRPLVY